MPELLAHHVVDHVIIIDLLDKLSTPVREGDRSQKLCCAP